MHYGGIAKELNREKKAVKVNLAFILKAY